jgi:hypothetical protein
MAAPENDAAGTQRSTVFGMNREVVVIDLSLLVFSALMFWITTDLTEAGRRAPAWILATLFVLVVLDLVLTRWHVVKGTTYLDETSDRIDEPMRIQLAFLFSLLLCGALIYFLGYRIATPVFLTIFLLAMRVRLKVLIPYVLGISGLIYFIFSEVLRVR